ncbi:MAG TPA: hypothetical protein VMV94_04120 [Phycisphaerae bacterium]|nr:hypothetical protein [Phycisphaerae bacterium]
MKAEARARAEQVRRLAGKLQAGHDADVAKTELLLRLLEDQAVMRYRQVLRMKASVAYCDLATGSVSHLNG